MAVTLRAGSFVGHARLMMTLIPDGRRPSADRVRDRIRAALARSSSAAASPAGFA
jgi:hypothetical protein